MPHVSMNELLQGLETVLAAPSDIGTVVMIVCRPRENAREVLPAAYLTLHEGLEGDYWYGSRSSADPETAITMMNARMIELIESDRERWPLAGDQLFVDFDLSAANLPPGTRLRVGEAVVQVSAHPHRGCGKFIDRFGADANDLVNGELGERYNLRGVNCRVISPGRVATGDAISHANPAP